MKSEGNILFIQEKVSQIKKLAKAITKGNINALQKFCDIYGKTIYSTARNICRSHEYADEVVNDVLIKVWKTADFILKTDNPEGWLHTVTANAAKDKIKQMQFLPLTEDIAEASDEYQKFSNHEDFYDMISSLKEVEQLIMIHKFVEDATFDKIAYVLDKPVSTITSIYYRALEKINKNFE